MISSPSGIPTIVVSDAEFHPDILRVPRAGASNKGGVRKSSHYLLLSINVSKIVADRAKVTIMTNRKSHMGFRLTPRTMTLDDPELL